MNVNKVYLDRGPVAKRSGDLLPPLHLDVLRGELHEQLLQPPLLLRRPRLVERHRFLLVERAAADKVLKWDPRARSLSGKSRDCTVSLTGETSVTGEIGKFHRCHQGGPIRGQN